MSAYFKKMKSMYKKALIFILSLIFIGIFYSKKSGVDSIEAPKSADRNAQNAPKVRLYIKNTCPYCLQAMALLKQKRIHFETFDLLEQPQLKHEMFVQSKGGVGKSTTASQFLAPFLVEVNGFTEKKVSYYEIDPKNFSIESLRNSHLLD